MSSERSYVIHSKSAILKPINFKGELNPAQFEAVTARMGPVLCIAGAGTGKTRTITYRVAWLLENGARPDSILLCTFTNKAAREMLNRVSLLTGIGHGRILGGTFHHIANVILRTFSEASGFSKNFGILDDGDSADLLSSLFDKSSSKGGDITYGGAALRPEIVLTIFGLSTNTGKSIEETVLQFFPYMSTHAAALNNLRERYERKKKDLNLMDFDGLLSNLKHLLSENPDIRAILSRQYLHILADEYQDTTRLQCDIVDLLAAPTGHDLMAVGDDAQSIYSFRGATIENMLGFPERHPDCNVISLTTNYRSSPQILNLANRVLSFNSGQFKKNLTGVKPPATLPVFATVRDGEEQSSFIAQRISELHDEGISLSEMAVLYRAHSHSMELQIALSRLGIPFIVRSGVRFFEQAHIKDVLSIPRFIWNPSDEISSVRMMKLFPGIGTATASSIASALRLNSSSMPDEAANPSYRPCRLQGRAEKGWQKFQKVLSEILNSSASGGSPGELISLFVKVHYGEVLQSRYPDAGSRMDDIEQLSAFAGRYRDTGSFIREISLFTNLEIEQSRGVEETPKEMLTLSSIHQAKGLEWRVVFIMWLSEGRFPSPLALKDLAGEEEERRLFYVSITRAKEDLYLCQPMSCQTRDRELKILRPSRFITELPDFGTLVERWSVSRV